MNGWEVLFISTLFGMLFSYVNVRLSERRADEPNFNPFDIASNVPEGKPARSSTISNKICFVLLFVAAVVTGIGSLVSVIESLAN